MVNFVQHVHKDSIGIIIRKHVKIVLLMNFTINKQINVYAYKIIIQINLKYAQFVDNLIFMLIVFLMYASLVHKVFNIIKN
jgi:hypothetical protein